MCHIDQECIEECRKGRPDEFRHLVVRYEKPVLAYLTGRMGNREAAAEAAQETFVRAFFGLDKLKDAQAFFPWLTGIAKRVALETFRRRRKLAPLAEAADYSAPISDPFTERDDELAKVVSLLPDAYREVIVLRYYGDMSCAEVADRLGVSLGVVTKRLSRSYVLLREFLAPHDAQRNEVQS